ncbi:MAG: hypothetical protein AB8B73_09170 [Ekhidna sp.]
MKKLSNLLAALVFGSLVIFMSCGGGDEPTPPTAEELQAALLQAGTWTSSSSSAPTYGGTPEGDWSGFSITLSGNDDGAGTGSYSTSGTPEGYEDVMPSSGNWSFVDGSNGTQINRTGGNAGDVVMSATVNETSLSLTFTVTDPAGRVSGLYGQPWVFTFGN